MQKNKEKMYLLFLGKLDSSVGIGVNNMIKKGAILTTCVEDILEYYPEFKERKRKEITQKKIFLNVREEYLQIINILGDKEKSIEELLSEGSFRVKELLKMLTNMELEGIITKGFGGKYKLRSETK